MSSGRRFRSDHIHLGFLRLTDPDSSEIIPAASPRFAHDFVLDSQGDQEQIYVSDPGGPAQQLSVLGR